MDYTKNDGEYYKIGANYGKILEGQVVTTESAITFVSKAEYEANNYDAQVEKIPSSITMRQAKLALLSKGLLDIVEGAISSMNSEAVNIEWQYATIIEFDNALVNQLCEALQIDKSEFFIYANSF